MNPNTAKTLIGRQVFLCAAAIAITSCGTATFSKGGSDSRIEGLRNFELAFIEEFAVPGKSSASAKQTSRGKVTSALAREMKKDVNKIYDHALAR